MTTAEQYGKQLCAVADATIVRSAAWQNLRAKQIVRRRKRSRVRRRPAGFDPARTAQAYFDVLAAQDTLASLQAEEDCDQRTAGIRQNAILKSAPPPSPTRTKHRRATISLQHRNSPRKAIWTSSAQRCSRSSVNQRPSWRPCAPASHCRHRNRRRSKRWVDSAEQQNFDVVSKQLALEIAMREITRNRAGHYPTVDLVASRSHTRPRRCTGKV
jgi:outer membrane protein